MEFIEKLVTPLLLVFVVASMVSMGLSLKIKQIIASISLKLVIVLIVVNFMIAPLLVYLLDYLINFDEDIFIGLIVIASAAGAPFLPKLTQNAKGDLPTALSSMLILVVLTIFYLPLALPHLIGGTAEVNSLKIVINLVISMLIPLSIGLIIHSKVQDFSVKLLKYTSKISNIALYLALLLGLIAYYEELIAIIGTGGIIAGILLILCLVVIGYFAGYLVSFNSPQVSKVIGLGSAQRNMAAALVVIAGFPNSLSYVLVLSILSLVILIPVSKLLSIIKN